MARYAVTEQYLKSLKKIGPEPRRKAVQALRKLEEDPPRSSLQIRKMEGHENLWEARVDLSNRLIMSVARDAEGPYFRIEDIGPHDVYKKWNAKR